MDWKPQIKHNTKIEVISTLYFYQQTDHPEKTKQRNFKVKWYNSNRQHKHKSNRHNRKGKQPLSWNKFLFLHSFSSFICDVPWVLVRDKHSTVTYSQLPDELWVSNHCLLQKEVSHQSWEQSDLWIELVVQLYWVSRW